MNALKNKIDEIYAHVSKTGELTTGTRRQLKDLDGMIEKLQDSASDNSEWKLCFDMRETIGELLNSEAALFA